jgi:hypothetical protein
MAKAKKATVPLAETALKRHFRKRPLQDLITASRTFPLPARPVLNSPADFLMNSKRWCGRQLLIAAR